MAPRKLRMSKRQAMAQQWRPLYELADRIKELAPWEWMDEDDIFGVQDPDTGEIGFVSVMGALDEHLCIAVYLGVNALYQFWELEDVADIADEMEMASQLLTIPQMQLSFENRDMIEKEDAGVMRKLNLNYSGRYAYPLFRDFKPGCMPYYLDVDQIPFLSHILEQTLDVASRFKEDETLLYQGDEEAYLLRVPVEENGEIRWVDEIRSIPVPETVAVPIVIDEQVFEKLKNAPRVGNSVEIDAFMLMAPVEGMRGERPFFPFSLLIADADSGMILEQDLLSPLPTMEHMYGAVPQKVMNMLLKLNVLPHEIHTQSPVITAVLSSAMDGLGVPVVEQSFLPMIDEAKTALMAMMGLMDEDED